MDVDETETVGRMVGGPVHRFFPPEQTQDATLDGRAKRLLADYDEWLDDRAELANQEASGRPPRAQDWASSDDSAVTLLQSFADLVREAIR